MHSNHFIDGILYYGIVTVYIFNKKEERTMVLTKEQIKKIVEIQPQNGWKYIEQFLRRIQPGLDSTDVEEVYDTEYNKKLEEHSVAYLIDDVYKIHIYTKYIYEYLLRMGKKNVNILEIGCGNGNLLLALSSGMAKDGCYVGVDFSQEAIDLAVSLTKKKHKENVFFYCMDINDFETEMKFDYIVLSDVIEHLSDRELDRIMKKCKCILNESGEILMHTPNALNECAKNDSNLYSRFIFGINHLLTRKVFTKSVEQIYYEQAHINLKSYRQWKTFFRKYQYNLEVIYDDCRIWKSYIIKRVAQFKNQTCGNMLLIAKYKK